MAVHETLAEENAALRQRIVELEQERVARQKEPEQQGASEAEIAALRQSQTMLQGILDHAPFLIFIKDLEGRLILVNRQLEHLVNMSQEELLGKTDYDILPQEEAERNRAIDREALATRRVVQRDEPVTGADGKEHHYFSLKFPIYDEHGEPYGVCGISADFTERKQMERDLQISENRQRALLDGIPDMLFRLSSDGVIHDYKASALDDLYVPPEAFIGKPMVEVLPTETAVMLTDAIGQAIATEQVQTVMYTLPGEDAVRFFEARIAPTKEGECIGLVRDMTERKKVEEELLIFKTLAENAPDAIGIAASDGLVTYANPAFREMFGYGDATIGMPNVSLFSEKDQREEVPALLQTVVSKGSWTGFLTGQRKDGSTFPMQLSPFAIYDDEGNVRALPAIVRDMTVQQQAIQEREALQEQVIEAQRAALRELSAPLLPISDRVIILPLVGSIDTHRAQQIMETLLEGIATHQANIAIIDITGVSVVDTQVANALIQAAQAVKLLGARVVLTGIGPVMAQTLVSLGADLSGIATRGTLQAGIAYALSG